MTDPLPDPTPDPPASPRPEVPPPLVVAASLAGLEGLVLLTLAVAELATTTAARATMGVSTALFFGLAGAALVLCGWGLWRLRGWARAPAVLAQLIVLLLAWSFRGEPVVAGVLLVVGAVTLAGVLHPRSMRALVGEQTDVPREPGD